MGFLMLGFLEALPMVGSFVLVILILVAAYYGTRWYARRMGPAIAGRNIRIIDRAALSHNSALIIASICGKYYLLGVSEKNVTLLRELTNFKEDDIAAQSVSFQKLFDKLISRGKAEFFGSEDFGSESFGSEDFGSEPFSNENTGVENIFEEDDGEPQ